MSEEWFANRMGQLECELKVVKEERDSAVELSKLQRQAQVKFLLAEEAQRKAYADLSEALSSMKRERKTLKEELASSNFDRNIAQLGCQAALEQVKVARELVRQRYKSGKEDGYHDEWMEVAAEYLASLAPPSLRPQATGEKEPK